MLHALKQTFLNLTQKSVEEAAVIDGCSRGEADLGCGGTLCQHGNYRSRGSIGRRGGWNAHLPSMSQRQWCSRYLKFGTQKSVGPETAVTPMLIRMER